MRTVLLLATALVLVGFTLHLTGVVEAKPPTPCLVGHSYWDGCVICVPPQDDSGCGCMPECAPR